MTPAPDELFDREGWWDPDCAAFRSLRGISEFRLALLRRWLPGDWSTRLVVDLGCGGGLVAIPLAATGARVIGVDVATTALRAATARNEPTFRAVAGDLDGVPVAPALADVVLLADVLEHVARPADAVAAAAGLLRPGGYLFVNTIHRTRRSRLLAITLGEGLGFIPAGTHRWEMFVTPAELDDMGRRAGLELVQRIGEAPRLWRTLRTGAIALRETPSLAVGYAALYRRAS
ncbi:MAG: 3-demethylubiquinone-9 3-O-methyltransferase [Planctomycetes bacterium]|nr:3-demethylubiquinone-9 3-O-methyltransferase [Planctomycetota bacterium]